ncbi:MAG: glucosidase, partial [Acidimicrobiia bacterium]|nr:glucosidase [Acidimicrobiia bacterium]
MKKQHEGGAERHRLGEQEAGAADWRLWGPYLSDRAWGTVREDYSPDGTAWDSFPHDHARSRAYRWNEDGLAGVSDHRQYLCFGLALWNGKDPILKERLFGLGGPEGNHGEDVKEAYFHLDATPSHSYLEFLYKYPQSAFPYRDLVTENQRRDAGDPEFELTDTAVFDESRNFDVQVTYAKASQDDLLVLIRVTNRGPDRAGCDVLPTLWFRNTWSWGYPNGPMGDVASRPVLAREPSGAGVGVIRAEHPVLGTYRLCADGAEALWFTENETNSERLWGIPNPSPYVKDAFHRRLIDDEDGAVNPAETGT